MFKKYAVEHNYLSVRMRKFSALLFLCLLTSPAAGYVLNTSAAEAREMQSAQQFTSERMVSLRIMIAKLRELVLNLKDIDDLEKVGLSQADAKLMKLALQEKINQTQSETLLLIRSL